MSTDVKTARLAGIFYLVCFLTGTYAEFFVRHKLTVAGDAVATAKNILASESVFRIGFVADLVAQASYFLTVLTLYGFLKEVHLTLARFCLGWVAISTAVTSLNMLNHFAVLILLGGSDYLNVFTAGQIDALALFFLNLHQYGYTLAEIFYGGWLLPFGYLLIKSPRFPSIIGIFVITAGCGYLVDFTVQFLRPRAVESVSPIALVPAIFGEFALLLWLLIRGVKTPSTQGV